MCFRANSLEEVTSLQVMTKRSFGAIPMSVSLAAHHVHKILKYDDAVNPTDILCKFSERRQNLSFCEISAVSDTELGNQIPWF